MQCATYLEVVVAVDIALIVLGYYTISTHYLRYSNIAIILLKNLVMMEKKDSPLMTGWQRTRQSNRTLPAGEPE